MPLLIGIDEAGYGPNLGPLVIVASIWHCSEPCSHGDLYDRLSSLVTPDPPACGDQRLWITDSKRVIHTPADRVRAAQQLVPLLPDRYFPYTGNLLDLWSALDTFYHRDSQRIPWYRHSTPSSMVEDGVDMDTLPRAEVRARLRELRVHCLDVVGRIVVEQRFNCLLRRYGNKSNVLSHVTLRLLRQLLNQYSEESMLVVCDRHGGRRRYAAILQQILGPRPILVREEDEQVSRYQVGLHPPCPQITFMVRSECLFATAFSSMMAKMVREIAMAELNAFWRSRIPDLRPTAGYPTDARRFRQDLAAYHASAPLPERLWWRMR